MNTKYTLMWERESSETREGGGERWQIGCFFFISAVVGYLIDNLTEIGKKEIHKYKPTRKDKEWKKKTK